MVGRQRSGSTGYVKTYRQAEEEEFAHEEKDKSCKTHGFPIR